MAAIVNQLKLSHVHSFQLLLTGSIHHSQLLCAVHQHKRPGVYPLPRDKGDHETAYCHKGNQTQMTAGDGLTHAQTDEVTVELELSLFDDMDGARLIFFNLNTKTTQWVNCFMTFILG